MDTDDRRRGFELMAGSRQACAPGTACRAPTKPAVDGLPRAKDRRRARYIVVPLRRDATDPNSRIRTLPEEPYSRMQHARASPCGKQRRQAAALHMRLAHAKAATDLKRIVKHRRRARYAVPLRGKDWTTRRPAGEHLARSYNARVATPERRPTARRTRSARARIRRGESLSAGIM